MGKIHHIIEAQQFGKELLSEVFSLTREMAELTIRESKGSLSVEEWEKIQTIGKNKRMISLFYRPSTRTRGSFETAMRILGGEVAFSVGSEEQISTTAKEKALEDTVRSLSLFFPHVIVLRHPQAGAAKRAAGVSLGIPIINAGDGTNQHPSQAIADLYTIWERFEQLDGLSIAMVGNLSESREVRSLLYLLANYKVSIYCSSPPKLRIGQDVKDFLRAKKEVVFSEIDDLREMAGKVDVIYQNRIRRVHSGEDMLFLAGELFSYYEIREKYSVNEEVLRRLPRESIVMDLSFRPEDKELSSLDEDARLVYYPQVQNGLFARMALLKMILAPE